MCTSIDRMLVLFFLYLVTRTFYTFLAMQHFTNLHPRVAQNTLPRKLVHGKTALFTSLANNRPTMLLRDCIRTNSMISKSTDLPLLLANPQLMECPEAGKYTAP